MPRISVRDFYIYGKKDKSEDGHSASEIIKINNKNLKKLLEKYDEDIKFKIDYKLNNTNLRGSNISYWKNILDNKYVVENVEYGTATKKEVFYKDNDGRKKLVPKNSKELIKIIEKTRLNNDESGISHLINQNQCQQYISNHYKADNHSAIIKAYFKTNPKSRNEAIKISKGQLKENPEPIVMQRETKILKKLMFDTCYMNESSSGNLYVHAVVDCYSRLCYFEPSPFKTADSMLCTLKNAITFFGGIPESVQCDNGSQNKNSKMLEYYVIISNQWDHHLDSIKDKLNTTRHSSINMAPYKAHFLKDPELPNMTASEKLTLGEYSREQIDKIINDQFDRNFKRFEQRRTNFKSYEVGTIVAVHYSQKSLIFSLEKIIYILPLLLVMIKMDTLDVEFTQSEDFGILFNEATVDKKSLKYKSNVEFREAETSKNKKQREKELARRESTIEQIGTSTQDSTSSHSASPTEESTSIHSPSTDGDATNLLENQPNTKIKNVQIKNKSNKKRANQLQSDAEFFTKRFINQTMQSISNKRVRK
ncbi:hypothetical protein ACTFIY_010264 [Dictyostelium cf. discoideum]